MPTTAARWNAFGFVTSFVLSLLLVFLRTPQDTILLFTVMGQGHFFLAYLYQWRAGKIDAKYVSIFAIALGALFLGLIYVPFPYLWTFVFAGSVFSIHFVVDELFISGLEPTRERVLLCIAFAISYSILLLRSAYGLTIPGVAVIVLLLVAPRIIQAIREKNISAPEMFCVSGIAILMCLWFVPKAITLAAVLGFIIFLHYIRWYFYYYFKLRERGDMARMRKYLRDVVLVNAIVFFGLALYWSSPLFSVFGYLFLPTYFYIWTIMHVITSARIPSLDTVWSVLRLRI